MSEKKRVPFLMDESPISVYPSLAKLLGNVNKAIILQQLHFLLNISKQADKRYNFVDERWWVYNNYKEWQSHFPWLGISTIKGLFGMLEHDGIILSRQGVKDAWDRRKWYTIDYDAFTEFVSCMGQNLSDVHGTKSVPSEGQNLSDDNKNTETTTETTTENSISPDGEVVDSKSKKPRKQNPMYDAIHAVWKYTAGRNGQMEKMLSGKATDKAHKDYNLETPITPDELTAWAAWYRRTNPGISIIESPVKIQSSITYWQETQKPRPVTDPEMDLSIAVPFDPKDNWK